MRRGLYLFLHTIVLLSGSAPVWAQDFSGQVEVESRLFFEDALRSEQHGGNLSVAAQPEFYYGWDRGYQSFTVSPFFRLDLGDPARSHVDLRELYWLKAASAWEVKVGLVRVFWGTTEAQHLVDIINQTDLVERPDGEAKLGQPMGNLTWIQSWGSLSIFIMPLFRERTFPGSAGRPGTPIPVKTSLATYTSGHRHRLDLAARWFHTVGRFDIGLSHFFGTSREPRLVPEMEPGGRPVLIPYYDVIHQTGLEAQATLGGWLWKLEGILRSGQGPRFVALAGGAEYTFSNIKGRGIDVGVLAEYLYDGRKKIRISGQRLSLAPFEDDLFLGARLAFNDVQDTTVLSGVVVDRETQATAFFLEGSRRLGNQWRLEVEGRGFVNTTARDLLYSLRKDDYLQISLSFHY